jgi:hypothetical protein
MFNVWSPYYQKIYKEGSKRYTIWAQSKTSLGCSYMEPVNTVNTYLNLAPQKYGGRSGAEAHKITIIIMVN